jgi:hypothetical protein
MAGPSKAQTKADKAAKKQKKKVDEAQLTEKRQQMDKAKVRGRLRFFNEK